MTVPGASLTVGVWQDSGVLGDVADNLATISRATSRASRRGVHLLVFPECFLTGYYNRDRVEQVARQIDQDTFSALGDLAKSNATTILVGYYEIQPEWALQFARFCLAPTERSSPTIGNALSTATGRNPRSCGEPNPSWSLTPCRSATDLIEAPGTQVSETMRALSSSDQRRCEG